MRYLIITLIVLSIGTIKAQSNLDVERHIYLDKANSLTSSVYGFDDNTLVEIIHISNLGTRKFQKEIESLLYIEEIRDNLALKTLDKIIKARKFYTDLEDLNFVYYRLIIVDTDREMYHAETLRL